MTNLIILPSFLGDSILMASGIIDKYKHEPSVIIANPKTAPLFTDLPNLNKLIVMTKKPWKKQWFEAWQETRGRKWGKIIDFRRSGLPYFLRAEKKMFWKDSTEENLHVVLQVSRCLCEGGLLSPTLWISEERLTRNKPNRPTLAVAPIPGWKGKQWPLENFITLLKTFCKTYPEAQVAVFAAPHEREIAEPLLKSLPKDQMVDTIGRPLLDSAALISSSRLFIGNDSGLMHVSTALNTPTIALFGPSNEKTFGPWSPQTPSPHRVIRGEPFSGCIRQVKETESTSYMKSLLVPPVWDVVKASWEAHR